MSRFFRLHAQGGYIHTHIVRKVVMGEASLRSAPPDDFCVKDLMSICPDEAQLMQALPRGFSGADLVTK